MFTPVKNSAQPKTNHDWLPAHRGIRKTVDSDNLLSNSFTVVSRVIVNILRLLAALLIISAFPFPAGSAENSFSKSANRLTYLDSNDPFYVGTHFPKLTTPQWVGEPEVEAVVILAIDDMMATKKYELFLRPILERLKKIDGTAPVSIMTNIIPLDDEQAQIWLQEGLTLDVHTIKHPCPLLANGNFATAAETYHSCIDWMNKIPGNKPVAFRMPCCDSMNSPSPRFYAEIFNRPTTNGNFLTIDSSIMNLFTTNDTTLPHNLVTDAVGSKFGKYFPTETNATTRVSMKSFATTIENYPYPFVIGKLCWEFPCAVPSDWEAHNFQGATNPVTIADWQTALDATVIKQGVMTMVFHPHGWIGNMQMIEFIDYAVNKFGNKVKFLTFREAQDRIDKYLLSGQPLRDKRGRDNGVRLLDLNNDGYMDVVIGNKSLRTTRIWDSKKEQWSETDFPVELISADTNAQPIERGVKFGITSTNGTATAFFRDETSKGAWLFDGLKWNEIPGFFSGLSLKGEPILSSAKTTDRGVRLRDLDNGGQCELLVGNETQNAVFEWSEKTWKKRSFALPAGTSFVNEAGQDNGLRFVDLNDDGYDDAIFSNEAGYSVNLFIAKPNPRLGWEVGWSYQVRSGKRGQPREIPMIVRDGPHRNNGAWFHAKHLWFQNEETATLPDKVDRRSFKELLVGDEPAPKSPEEAQSTFRLQPGFKIELVASEPMVKDPVAFDWGPDGKFWVVEMGDYPLGLDGKGKPGGVVRFLEDTNNDGQYDKSTIFLEGLNFPNGILPWRKGVLISAAPDIIYAEDSDGDGKADVQKILFTGFHEGNQQHRINGFEYGLDNWLYSANGGSGGKIHSVATGKELDLRGHDLRMRPDEGLMELQTGNTQYGRRRDDWNNWFGNNNGNWVWHFFLEEKYAGRNPFAAVGNMTRDLANYPDANRVFSLSRPQQRFNWPDRISQVTSACSPTPYRDNLFGKEFTTTIFISEPANNVVHREVLEQDGVSFKSHRAPAEQTNEFLASTDNWFRPTSLKTGPDGALYIADMYRLVLEHPEYFPEELKSRPDLRAGDDKGRIYRVYPDGVKLRNIPRFDQLRGGDLVAALESENGWQRDTVQRLLVESKDKRQTEKPLKQLLKRSLNPKVRLQVLGTLEGLDLITPDVLESVLNDSHYSVRRFAVRLSEQFFEKSPTLDSRLLQLVKDPDVSVRYQLALSLGDFNDKRAGTVLAQIAMRDWNDSSMQMAVLSSATNHITVMLQTVLAETDPESLLPDLFEKLVNLAAAMRNEQALSIAIENISKPQSGHFAGWQFSGALGFLNALEQQGNSFGKFQNEADKNLRKTLLQLENLFQQARTVATSSKNSEAERLFSIRLLGRTEPLKETDILLLGQLLDSQNPVSVQQAALSALKRSNRIEATDELLKNWNGLSPNQRRDVLGNFLNQKKWMEALLAALESEKISTGDISTPQQQKLLNHSDERIRSRAAKLFASTNHDREKVVKLYKGVEELKADRTKGRILFQKNCAPCHQLNGEGFNVGPDLGTLSGKPIESFTVAILDPNQAIDPTFAAYNIITRDDRELSGIIAAETANSLSLRTAGGLEEIILRNNIKQLAASKRSLMPEGFEAALNPQDLADLISYILNPLPKS